MAITASRLGARRVRAAMLLLLASILLPATVTAHGNVERSIPDEGAIVAEAPPLVELWFTQELFRREGANAIEVYGPEGAQVDLGDSAIDDDDRSHLTVSLPSALPPGLYTVRWRNLSADDGHAEEGEFTFTVDPAAPPAATEASQAPAATEATVAATPVAEPPAASAPSPAAAGSRALPVGVGLLALIALATFLGWRSRR